MDRPGEHLILRDRLLPASQHKSTLLAVVGDAIVSAARFYHEQHHWLLSLFLVMPDHAYLLVSFGRERKMGTIVGAWKRFLANQHGILWQKNFFDHRPRTEAWAQREADYILQNPVRAGLVQTPAEWPFVWTPSD